MCEDGLDDICFTWAGALKFKYLSWGHTEDKAGCYQGVEHGGRLGTFLVDMTVLWRVGSYGH